MSPSLITDTAPYTLVQPPSYSANSPSHIDPTPLYLNSTASCTGPTPFCTGTIYTPLLPTLITLPPTLSHSGLHQYRFHILLPAPSYTCPNPSYARSPPPFTNPNPSQSNPSFLLCLSHFHPTRDQHLVYIGLISSYSGLNNLLKHTTRFVL